MDSMARKIKALRLSLGLTQPELGKKMIPPVPQSTVSKWETGKQKPDATNSKRLADLAGVDIGVWLGISSAEVPATAGRRVQVVGAVAAGEWSEDPDWPESARYEISGILPDKWANTPVHAFEVRGESVNRVYPNGSIVFAIPLENAPGAPKSGQLVIAIRRSADGTYERTIKEYRVTEDGRKWLWPKSDSPEHQAPISLKGTNRRTSEVYIAGVVIGSGFIPAPGL